MDIEIKDPSNGNIHTVEWNSPQSPKQEDVEGMLAQIQGQGQEPSLPENVVSDVKDIVKGLPMSIGQTAATAGKGALDLMTGASIRSMLPAGKSNAPINEPSILNMIRGKQAEAISEEPKYEPQNIGKTMYEHPLNNIPVMAATMAIPSFFKGKAAKSAMPYKGATIDTAEVLPTNLEKTNIQNIAINKYVRDNTKNFLGKQAPEIAKEAADMIKQVKPAIRKAQNEFYQKLGIKDSDLLDDRGLALAKIQNEIENAAKYLDESDLKKAKAIFGDLGGNEPSKPMTFGKVKNVAQMAYDLAEDNVNEMGKKTMAGRFYTNIGNALTELKHSDPRISKASGQFLDLMNAERLINKSMRLNREMGEMRLESKIASSFKDKGQLTFKENLQNLEDILKKYPETQHLVKEGGFTDKIKLAQLANDIASKKAVLPTGMGRIPIVKMLGNMAKIGDPEFHAQILAKGIKSGRFNPEAIAGKTKLHEGIFGGKSRTMLGGIGSIMGTAKKPSILQMILGGK